MQELLKQVVADNLVVDRPKFSTGDTVAVSVQIVEGQKTRVQLFEGVVIQKKGSGIHETFTVRKISGGIGVERIFPLNSPRIESIKVVREGKVRRARIFYLRERSGKSARIKQKIRK